MRQARLEDAGALAEIWIASWNAAYRGMLDDAILDAMTRARRMAQWLAHLLYLDPGTGRVFVAETRVGDTQRVVGLCETAPAAAGIGEIFTLYVAPDCWGRGLGAALLEHACDDFAARGFERVVLWVLQDNARARGFYERKGFRFDGGRRIEDIKGRPVSLRYGRTLARARRH